MKDQTDNARALMAQFNSPSGFNHKAFLTEMDARSFEAHGHGCTVTQQRLLARIVKAYLSEVQS